jgi:hypothetical protein
VTAAARLALLLAFQALLCHPSGPEAPVRDDSPSATGCLGEAWQDPPDPDDPGYDPLCDDGEPGT